MRVEFEHDIPRELSSRRLRSLIDAALGRGAQEIADEARHNAPVAFGILQQSIHVTRVDWNRYQVLAGTNHAGQVEKGRRPGGPLPNPRSIEAWMKTKRIQPYNPGTPLRTAAYFIASHIQTHGTPAQPFLNPAAAAKRKRLEDLLEGALREFSAA